MVMRRSFGEWSAALAGDRSSLNVSQKSPDPSGPGLFASRLSSQWRKPLAPAPDRALAPEQRQQDDDGQRNAQKPEKCTSTESHDGSPQSVCVVGPRTHRREPGSESPQRVRRRVRESKRHARVARALDGTTSIRIRRSSGPRTCRAWDPHRGSRPARSPEAKPGRASGRSLPSCRPAGPARHRA
jgi:hypothetical protein